MDRKTLQLLYFWLFLNIVLIIMILGNSNSGNNITAMIIRDEAND